MALLYLCVDEGLLVTCFFNMGSVVANEGIEEQAEEALRNNKRQTCELMCLPFICIIDIFGSVLRYLREFEQLILFEQSEHYLFQLRSSFLGCWQD